LVYYDAFAIWALESRDRLISRSARDDV
jgi:hypothetical protein